MIYWTIYDISENKIRSKIANLCKDYGLERVQESAFLGDLTRNKAEMLALEIKKFINEKSDKVFIVPAGKAEFVKKIILGQFNSQAATKPEVIFIE